MNERIDVDARDVVKFIVDGGLKDAFGNEEVRNYCLRTLSDFGCKPPTNRLLLFCCVRAGSPLMGYALRAANTNLLALLQKHPRIAGLFSKIASLCRQERDKERLKDHLMALMRGECANPPALDAASDLSIVQSLYQSQKLEGLDKQLQALSAQHHPKLAEILAKLQHDPVEHLMDQWLEGDTDSIADRIRYNSGIYPFVGRHNEIDLLDRFLGEPVSWSSDQAFRWLLLTGDGGTGKTRLAMEYVRHNLPAGWVGRRLPVGELDTMILWAPDWLPKAPTLIVLDYPAQRPEDVHRLLERLLRRSPYFDFPVRVLLLERDAADGWFDTAFPASGDGAALRRRAHVKDGQPLLKGHALKPPEWVDIADLLDRHLGHLPEFVEREEALRDYVWRIDPQSDGTYRAAPRPIYVLATIEWLLSAHAEGRDWRNLIDTPSSSEELLLSIIERDRAQFWRQQADAARVDLMAHEHLIALASFMLGLEAPLGIRTIAADVSLGHLFPDQPSIPLLHVMGRIENGTLRELEPDLLGECHTLHQLLWLQANGDASAVARFCQLAFRHGGDRAAAVAIRYMRDFPHHVRQLDWLAPPPGAGNTELAAFGGYAMSIIPVLEHDELSQVCAIVDGQIDHCLTMPHADALERLAKALVNKGIRLGQIDQPREEIAAYDDLVARFGDSALPAVQEEVAKALVNKGITLGLIDQPREAIAVYDDLVARFGDSALPALQEQVNKALVNKGITLGLIDQPREEIAVYDDLVARFGDSALPALQEQVAIALFYKGITLGQIDQPREAIADYDDLVARFGDSALPALQEEVAMALLNKGITLGQIDQPREAIAAYHDLVARFGDSALPALQEQVTKALVNKGITLGQIDQPREAIAAYHDLVARFGDSALPALQEQVTKALFLMSAIHAKLDSLSDCLTALSRWRDHLGAFDCIIIHSAWPLFEPLHNNPDFIAFLRDNGCEPPAAD